MAINKAKYIFNDGERENKHLAIYPSQIKSREEYSEKYKNHLFCSEIGCTAKLDYVQIDSPYQKKYFRTHPRSKHSDDCPNRFENIANGISKYGENLYAQLDEEAKKQILTGTYKKATGAANANTSNSKSGRKSTVVNKNNGSKETTRYISTVDPDAEPIPDGKRRTPVKKRDCDSLSSDDIGKTRSVYGKINNVDVGKNYININVLSETNGLVHYEFYTPFQNNSRSSYELLRNYNNGNKMIMNDDLIIAIGIVEKRDDGYYIPVMDDESISVNRKYLTNYFTDKSSTI